MNADSLKLYSVMVGEGSGCFFQPMTKDYSYILTAKHLFETNKDEDGKEIRNDKGEIVYDEKPDGYQINITCHKKVKDQWEEEILKFKKIKGETYFPHKNADIAILKIDYKPNVTNIFCNKNIEDDIESGYELCGFPESFRKEKVGSKYTSHIIKEFNTSGNYCHYAQIDERLNQNNISGFSGGGILKEIDNCVYIIGIQSEMATKHENCQVGKIGFVPMRYFDEIVFYPEYENCLKEFLPYYMANFEFLKDKAFDIDAGIDDEDISYTRYFLRQKAQEVIESDITPYCIKNFFKERLLLNEKNPAKLEKETIYTTWLEFLTIMNIVKSQVHSKNDLENIFNQIRLIYKDTSTNWQDHDFLKECLIGNYNGLKESGTVLIKTNTLPPSKKLKHYIIKKGDIVSRIDALKKDYLNGNLVSDVQNIGDALCTLNEFVFDKYNFIHFEYLKQIKLIENSENFREFKRGKEVELLQKLKEEYEELFGL